MAVKQQELAVHWWALTVRGIAALLFGVAAVFWPKETLVALVYLVSAYVLAVGIVNIIEGIMALGKHRSGVLTAVVGFAEVIVGLYLVRHPHVTFATFILVFGFLLIATGILEVVASLAGNAVSSTGRAMAVIVGLLAIVVGVVLLFQPAASGVALVWLLGVYALISGPILIAMSLDVKHMLEG